ncbi:hypothetical protein BCV70DRAFT_201618 [Testicularia cyperi]|uniref:ArfGap-domain-containing protein n=1 Tax=Testicularia cyperi TaxID=1882483 RepID=A0A317XLT2_9BASI|nr:hypothetical protein BCV70DRAFT_201618 [Testicularia cyperi]
MIAPHQWQMTEAVAHSAFNVPGHALYLDDPHRLSILSLSIDAVTHISTSRMPHLHSTHDNAQTIDRLAVVSSSQQQQPKQQSQLQPSTFLSSASQQRQQQHRNSQQFFQPATSSTPSTTSPVPNTKRFSATRLASFGRTAPVSGSNSASTSSGASPHPAASGHSGPPSSYDPNAVRAPKARPISLDFGSKAREALSEIGRFARNKANTQERANAAEALAKVANGLSPAAAAQSMQPPPSSIAGNGQRERSPDSHLASDSATVVTASATRTTTLKPQSFTFGRDSRLTSSVIPLTIECESGVDQQRSTSPPASVSVEFIADPSPAPTAISAAGVFTAEYSDSLDTPNSSSNLKPTARSTAAFDPTRLLLKVAPPAQMARHSWSSKATFLTPHNSREYSTVEANQVTLRFRLRLCASAFTSTRPSAATTSPTDSGLGQVLFLSADSPGRLSDAIASPASSISSDGLASLEGISRVEINPPASAASTTSRGARDCDFEWIWKPLGQAATRRESRCCCAFVELNASQTSATVLAAYSFWIELPSPLSGSLAALAGPVAADTASRIAFDGMTRTDSMDLIAALNRDLATRTDLFDSPMQPEAQLAAVSATVAPDSMSASSRTQPPSAAMEANATSSSPHSLPAISIDHTELSLGDLNSDSPIFRAALANLERRTASMKRQGKVALKAATEARTRILRLMEAEDIMDEALDGLVTLTPDTLGQLRNGLMLSARHRNSQHRRQQATIIEQNVEKPLEQIVEICRVTLDRFKTFEAESKSYYSQTQKWLSNRAAGPDAPTSNGASSGGGGTAGVQSVTQMPNSNSANDRSVKQERADEKQKLRELRFEQARLDLFAAVSRLHGGRIEAQLAQCILRICRWHTEAPSKIWGPDWPSSTQAQLVAGIDGGVDAALRTHESQSAQLRSRSQDLADRIRRLETSLSGSIDTDPEGFSGSSMLYAADGESNLAEAPAVQSKSRKLKTFLGAITSGIHGSPIAQRIQGSAVSNWSATPDGEPNAPTASPGSAATSAPGQSAAEARRRLSLKLKVDRGGSSAGHGLPSPSLSSQAPSSWRHGELLPSPRNFLDGTHSSDHGGSRQDHEDALLTGQDSEETRGAADAGLGIATGQAQTTLDASSLPPSYSTVTIAASPGGERKKEGVLWVMSKSVTGPAGADAPRAVSRAAHWRECWVVLSGSGQISEYADWKNAKVLEPSHALIDLRFATVREARGVDRRFAFEVVTRDSRRFFQAADEEGMRDWMRAIGKAIESLLNGTSSVRKLDRAVRASPFNSAGSQHGRNGGLDEAEEDPLAGEGNDFGVRKLLDVSSRAFTQSMTDLQSTERGSSFGGKRGGHMSTLSESHTESARKLPSSSSKRRSRHERGISNKTPISGYLGSDALGLSGADAAVLHGRAASNASEIGSYASVSAGGEHITEFDRNIEALVQRSYGAHEDEAKNNGFSAVSADTGGVDEMGLLRSRDASQGQSHTRSSTTGRTPAAGYSRNVNNGTTNTNASTKMSRAAEVGMLSRMPGNTECADCRSPDPRWASWMLANEPCCIFICIGCSGVHRSLGVHISKVKSVDLDDWTEEQLQAARDWGNARANALWEYSKPPGMLPAPEDRRQFWQTKYIEARWRRPTAQPAPATDTDTAAVESAAEMPSPKTTVPDDELPTPTQRNPSFGIAASVAGVSSQSPRSRPKPKLPELSSTPRRQGSVAGVGPGPSSPRPSGPRPLPGQQRSASMTAIPAASPPPLSPRKLGSMSIAQLADANGLTTSSRLVGLPQIPTSPSFPASLSSTASPWADASSETPWPPPAANGFLPSTSMRPADLDALQQARRRLSRSMAMPASLLDENEAMSRPSGSLVNIHSNRIAFPSKSSQPSDFGVLGVSISPRSASLSLSPRTSPRKPRKSTETSQMYAPPSPPSSFFVSNLAGTSPSPTFYDATNGKMLSSDTESDGEQLGLATAERKGAHLTSTSRTDGEARNRLSSSLSTSTATSFLDSPSESMAPARFEPIAMAN